MVGFLRANPDFSGSKLPGDDTKKRRHEENENDDVGSVSLESPRKKIDTSYHCVDKSIQVGTNLVNIGNLLLGTLILDYFNWRNLCEEGRKGFKRLKFLPQRSTK